MDMATPSMLDLMRRARDLLLIVADDFQHNRRPTNEIVAELVMITALLKAQTSALLAVKHV